MIYPDNYEIKVGFNEIRKLLKSYCLSSLGKEKVDDMAFSSDASKIKVLQEQTREFRRLSEKSGTSSPRQESDKTSRLPPQTADSRPWRESDKTSRLPPQTADFPLRYFFDVRESVSRLRLEGTYMEESDMHDLKRSLTTIIDIVSFLNQNEDGLYYYPTLHSLTTDIMTFPQFVNRIDDILDKYGKMKDTASQELSKIRKELSKAEGSVSRTLNQILRSAQSDGLIEKDTSPTLRDGRLVIPISPGMKRRIKGIVHDESATGKTVFIEPTEVVEANNHIRELENEERKEIIRILKEFAQLVRPYTHDIIHSFKLLAEIDFIQAKTVLSREMKACEPDMVSEPHIDWVRAYHPLLQFSLEHHGKKMVPLDITLEASSKERGKSGRLLIISGPNAGGKSVCLKTVGLLQYMLQCGLSIPVAEQSKTGVFDTIMIDIGDEQSIENDLSTYSSHLMNMKNMIRNANPRTLLLIDEFGTGTEPQIGGAIAESVLNQFCKKKAWGIITTHYQNLKHFAEDHEGVVNGAMLYDRHEMRALFQLAIGRPGSSFAIEIARKTGLPEDVIQEASEIVGSEYIQSDKYLQDIVRDKRYWEGKRQTIHQREKDMERTITRYESNLSDIEKQRKEIIRRAKEQAEELLNEANKRIENTIREIREAQAEKMETRRIREELNEFRQEVSSVDSGIMSNDDFAKKLKQLEQRKERKERRKAEKAKREQQAADALKNAIQKQKEGIALSVGDTVQIKGQTTVGILEAIDGKTATAVFGGMRTRMRLERLEHADAPAKDLTATSRVSKITRETIDDRRKDFRQDIDIRGMRGDEALNQIQYFIDDAILVGVSRVRILHGKGNGILRQLIRQYLHTVPNVSNIRDEHVQFGGAGITVVDLG